LRREYTAFRLDSPRSFLLALQLSRLPPLPRLRTSTCVVRANTLASCTRRIFLHDTSCERHWPGHLPSVYTVPFHIAQASARTHRTFYYHLIYVLHVPPSHHPPHRLHPFHVSIAFCFRMSRLSRHSRSMLLAFDHRPRHRVHSLSFSPGARAPTDRRGRLLFTIQFEGLHEGYATCAGSAAAATAEAALTAIVVAAGTRPRPARVRRGRLALSCALAVRGCLRRGRRARGRLCRDRSHPPVGYAGRPGRRLAQRSRSLNGCSICLLARSLAPPAAAAH